MWYAPSLSHLQLNSLMPRQSSSRENILSQIIRTADEIRLISKNGIQKPSALSSPLLNSPALPYPAVPFVDPPNLLPDLVEAGLELATAKELYQGFLKRISEFKQAVEKNFSEVTSRLSQSKTTYGCAITSHVKDQLVNAYRMQYERAVESWSQELLLFVSAHQNKIRYTRTMRSETTPDPTTSTSPFNNVGIFNINARCPVENYVRSMCLSWNISSTKIPFRTEPIKSFSPKSQG